MQYSALSRVLVEEKSSEGGDAVVIPRQLFTYLISSALRRKNEFDEHFYINTNGDIREALESGAIASAADHYFATGYFEGRAPKFLMVDERFYLKNNPDVAEAIKKGLVRTAQEHFEYAGFREGRIPYEGFSLF